jgi:hypothetical protein
LPIKSAISPKPLSGQERKRHILLHDPDRPNRRPEHQIANDQ